MKRLTAILTAALLLLTVALPAKAEPDESSVTETSVAQTSASESDTEVTSTEETSTEESDSEVTSIEESGNSSASSEDSISEKSDTEKSSALETSSAEEITMKPYRIEEAKLDISIPSNMSVITRNTKENDPVFEENRTTKEECDKNFAENDIYLRANTKDFSCSVSVVVNETEDTKKIGNLSSLSEELIRTIINKIQESPIYTGCARVTYNGVLFLSFTIAYDSEGTKVHGLQEYTIIDGKCVKITYQTAASEENDPNKASFGQIMETAFFDGVTVTPSEVQEKTPSVSLVDIDIRFIYIMIAAAIGVISLMIIILVGIKYNQTKRRNEKDVLNYNDDSDDDSDIDDSASDAKEDSMDIYSDTGKKKEPSVEAKPMTYDDVISARGNFNAKEMKTSEKTENVKEPENDAPKKSDDVHHKKITAEVYDNSNNKQEQLFIIIDTDEEDVPQAPLEWDDIPEGALDSTLKPSLDELKKEGLQEEAYKKAWNAAKAARMARVAQQAQAANNMKNTDPLKAEKTAESSKGEKTAKTDKKSKLRNSDKNNIPVTEATMEIPELSNAPEYVPITGFAAEDITNKTKEKTPENEKTVISEKEQPANENEASAETKQSENKTAAYDETNNLPNGDVPKDMKNFFKFNKQKENTESVNKTADIYEGASMKNVTPLPPEDNNASESQNDNGTFEFYTGYSKSDSENDSDYEKRFGENTHDTPASAAAAAVESAVLAGMIDRLRTANEEANKDIEKNENNLTGEKILNDVAVSGQTSENSIYKAQEEKKAQNNEKSGSIELEISKAADGSLVIGAKNDANGQPMDIEIRDASRFKEERDKEMAAMGLETASDNEIYNAWKIENEEKPFIVKTVSEVEAEESIIADTDTVNNEKDNAPEKIEETVSGSENVSEKAEASNEPLNEETETAFTDESDDTVDAVVAVLDPANLGTKNEETNDKSDTAATEEFFEGVKSAAPLEAGGIDPKEQQPERDENMFEKESGISFERPSEYQPPIVPMNTPFTRVPRLETVNAEKYHREYDELKKTLPKNQFYAQRFSSANITQPFIETPKPITTSSESGSEQSEEMDSINVSEKNEKHFGRNRKNRNKQKEKPAETQDNSSFEYYTGYEETDDPFSVQNPDEELLIKDHKKKSNDSFGSKFKKSFSSIFSNDIPDE